MKTWQLAITIAAAIAVTALVTTSTLVLINTPRTSVIYTSNPNGYYPPQTATPQVPTPKPFQTNPPQTANPTVQPSLPPLTNAYNQTITSPNQVNATANPPSSSSTINDVLATAQNYLIATGNPDLAIKKIEEYSQNFYVQIYERSTGAGAFELTANKYTGVIFPESGPTLTWNTKYKQTAYGIMQQTPYGYGIGPGGMGGEGEAGWFGGQTNANVNPNAPMTISPIQALAAAQQYLNTYLAGTTPGQITAFYGYYTIEVQNNGALYGLISVNGYTGQVWYHTWHGTFEQQAKLY